MAFNYGLDGVEALREAVSAVGLVTDEGLANGGTRSDLDLVIPGGDRVMVALKRVSLVSAEGLAERLGRWNRELSGSTVGVVVADRVTREAREILRAAGWGWLDLRGHLHIAGQGVFVDADVPPLREGSTRSSPLAGRVGIEVAAAVLMDPSAKVGIRSLAGSLNRAPSSVSDVLSSMQSAGLVDGQRKPALPELFWELADRWQSLHADIQATPSPGRGAVNDALKVGFDDVETTTGWALTDTVAAATYGAPVSVRSDHPRDFYVPDQAALRRAVHLLGAAADRASRAASVRVAPVPMICSRRVDATGWANEEWPLAQPLFVALDLAQDRGRGREILNAWTPTEPWHRVW